MTDDQWSVAVQKLTYLKPPGVAGISISARADGWFLRRNARSRTCTVRLRDGTSNNLIEADAASSDADFLNKMRIALREAKESKACLTKIRLGPLANAPRVEALGLEAEADELCAVYATIIMNTEKRMVREAARRPRRGALPIDH